MLPGRSALATTGKPRRGRQEGGSLEQPSPPLGDFRELRMHLKAKVRAVANGTSLQVGLAGSIYLAGRYRAGGRKVSSSLRYRPGLAS